MKEIKCLFCGKKEGILKILKEKKDKWTHINCMKWFLNVRLESENGFTIFKTEKNLPGSIWTEECSSCKKTVKGDFFIKCNKLGCEKYFHTKCIQNNCVEEIKANGINYFLFHCQEHKNSKKGCGVFCDVKTYGKNININSSTNASEAASNIKVLKDFEESKVITQDIILKTFKPVIINDEENKINKLKIKMKFTDETCSSNGSINGIRTHAENMLQETQSKLQNFNPNMNFRNNSSQFKSNENFNNNKLSVNTNIRNYENIELINGKNVLNNSCLNINKIKQSLNGKPFSQDNTIANVSSICYTKINKSSVQFQESHNSEDDDDNDGALEFVSSFSKCDICAKLLEGDESEKMKQCNNCLTHYHSICAKDFGDKLDSEFCKKCQSDKFFEESCFVCGRFKGSMIKCDNNWVHIFCMMMLKGYFYKKNDYMFQMGLDKYKLPKSMKKCLLCNISNAFTLKCSYCDLMYHPYCGLISNFDFCTIEKKISGSSDLLNKFEISCACDNHFMFLDKFKMLSNNFPIVSKNSMNSNGIGGGTCSNASQCDSISKSKSNTKSSNKNSIKNIEPHSVTTFTNKKGNDRIKYKKPMIKCKLSSVNNSSTYNTSYYNLILSINLKNLKKFLNDKFDFNYFTKVTEWNWNITDSFFYKIDEKILSCLDTKEHDDFKNTPINEDSMCKEIIDNYKRLKDNKTLSVNQKWFNERRNHVICEFKNKKSNSNFIGIYDTAKISDIKLDSNYLSFFYDLNNLKESENFSFLSKRKRSEEDHKIFPSNPNFIFTKNLKIIEDEEEVSQFKNEFQINGNSIESISKEHKANSTTTSTKMKILIEDSMDVVKNNGEDSYNDFETSEYHQTNSIHSNKINPPKFLKKLRLFSYFKLRKKDRFAIICEEYARQKIFQMLKENNLCFSNLEDFDAEILIKNQLLHEVNQKNKKNLENLRKKIAIQTEKEKDKNLDSSIYLNFPNSELFMNYKLIIKWGFIKRRLALGVKPKSLEEILKNKIQNLKPEKSMNTDKAEYVSHFKSSCEEIKSIDSECCVCFYSDAEDTTPIVFCDSCNVSVHPLCYGIKEIPEGDYFCDLCHGKNKTLTNKMNIHTQLQNQSQSQINLHSAISKEMDQKIINDFRNIKCMLCLNKNGALKQLDRNGEHWAHVTCILFSKNLNFKDFLLMDEVEGMKQSNMLDISTDSICIFCNNTSGDLFFCSHSDNCSRSFHFFCAYLNGNFMSIEDIGNKKLLPRIYCDSHIPDKSFKPSEQKELRVLTYHKEMPERIDDSNRNSEFENIKDKSRYVRNREDKISPNKCEKPDKYINYKDELLLNWLEIQNPIDDFSNNISDFSYQIATDNKMDVDSEETEFIKPFDIPANYDDSKCAVCFSGISENGYTNFRDMKNRDDVLTTKCSRCGIRFHNRCYYIDINASKILCDYCKQIARFKQPDKPGMCLLCPNTGGALKKCKNKNNRKVLSAKSQNIFQSDWIHVICANYTKEIYLNNNLYSGFHNIPPTKFDRHTCELCKKNKGLVIKCAVKSCDSYFHSYCSITRKMHKEKKGDSFVIYCSFHTKLYDECLSGIGIDMHSLSNSLKKNLEYAREENSKINLIKNINYFSNNESSEENLDNNEKISLLVSPVIKYILDKFQAEELFYNLLKIGI